MRFNRVTYEPSQNESATSPARFASRYACHVHAVWSAPSARMIAVAAPNAVLVENGRYRNGHTTRGILTGFLLSGQPLFNLRNLLQQFLPYHMVSIQLVQNLLPAELRHRVHQRVQDDRQRRDRNYPAVRRIPAHHLQASRSRERD